MEEVSGLLEAVVSEPFLDIFRGLELHVKGFRFQHFVDASVFGEGVVVVGGLGLELTDDPGMVFLCDNVAAVAVLHDVGGLMGHHLPDGCLVGEVHIVFADDQFVGDVFAVAVVALDTCFAVAEGDGGARGFDHVREFLQVFEGFSLSGAAEGHQEGGPSEEGFDHGREVLEAGGTGVMARN